MRVRPSFTLLMYIGLVCSHPVLAQEQGKPLPGADAIHINVNVVNLGVTVRDSSGKFVSGLRREDFRVFDNGAEQPINGFLSIDEPAQLVLMLEAGPAALFTRKFEIAAAEKLLRALAPADRVAIVTYSRGAFLSLDFTQNKMEALEVLRGINFMVGFSQLDLSPNVAAIVEWLGSKPGKKSLILLSSGIDTSSEQYRRPALERIKTSDVRIFAVSVTEALRIPAKGKQLSPDDRADRQYVKQNMEQGDQALREITQATGGRAFFPKDAHEFDRAFDQIAESVRHEYSLAFAPPVADGKLHTIKVKVDRLWSRADYRQAYLAPPPSP